MSYDLSVVDGIPDAAVSYVDDVFLQDQETSWDSRRLALDGIIIMYTNFATDTESFAAISNGLFCPNYLIAAGGGTHPSNGARSTHAGQVFQLVSERYRAKFCSTGVYPYSGFVSPFNGYWRQLESDRLTIGIALVGTVGQPLLPEQLTSLGSLISDITSRVSSVSQIVGRRHVMFSEEAGNTMVSDPEPSTAGANRVDFSDATIFGKFANELLNHSICWGADGHMYIYSGGTVARL